MPFNFNPSLWFVCKLCREAFSDTDKLKAHKLESHLGESLNIKCIVFEEKLLDHQWIPPSPAKFASKQDQLLNLSCALLPEIDDGGDLADINNPLTEFKGQNQKQNKLKNPYVSLKRLTAHEINPANSASASEIGTAGTRSNKVEHFCNVGSTNTNERILSKRKQNFASEVNSFPSKLRIKTDIDDDHVTKIRKLLSSAVIIKSESTNDTYDTDNRAFFEPQDLPISIVSTYSIPSNTGSEINNPVNENNSFNLLQQQQSHQWLHLPEHSESAFPSTSVNDNDNTFTTGKVEFTEYDLSAQNPNCDLEASFIKTPAQILDASSSSDPPLPSELTAVRQNTEIQRPFACQLCNASYCRNYSLRQHMLSRHSDYRLYQCPQCELTFKLRGSLRGHLIAHHGVTTASKCRYCGKCFPARANLLSHESTHTGLKDFKCQFPNCGREYNSRPNLIIHTRMKHGDTLGLEQFVCPTCGQSFGLRSALNRHQKVKHPNVVMMQQILS